MQKVLRLISLLFIPLLAIVPLLGSGYFSMHDNQHVVRLYLLNEGIQQGQLFPRWVDGLGFGYGYPLFNFYPPLIYYVAEIFVLLGFSLVSSLKLMLITGFVAAALSSYLYLRLIFNRKASYAGAVLYTYTFYHAITIYVRGAFAEFFSMALFPLVAYFLHSLIIKPNLRKCLGLGISLALMILCHPLLAFPSLIFIGAYYLLAILVNRKWLIAWVWLSAGNVLGLLLSAFFWLPSLLEKKYSLVDAILTKELFNYKLHFVDIKQLYYSPWGFGGSVQGVEDGMSFQIGKYFLLFLILSWTLAIIYFWQKKDRRLAILFVFFNALLFLSYFMTLAWSLFIWEKVHYLWYLQFPWRFLTFASFYLSIVCALAFFLIGKIFANKMVIRIFHIGIWGLLFVLVFKYQGLFRPQTIYQTTDKALTTEKQVKWVISKSSFEFVPKGVALTKNELGVTTLDIKESQLPRASFQIIEGEGKIIEKVNFFAYKKYSIQNKGALIFQLNTYDYPGWEAKLNGELLAINNTNRLHLIRVEIPKGEHELEFSFKNTWPRTVGNLVSMLALIFILSMVVVPKKEPGSYLWEE